MPLRSDIKKVMVLGSGPIVIGQAAEFDYAGTQACRALREEGLEVVLVNSNPATIMTDKAMADKVYIEPMTVEAVKEIIKKERPDSLLPNLGGQTGLNLAMELCEEGFLDEMGVKLLGANPTTIAKAEDRQMFKDTMEKIGEPIIASKVVHTVEDAVAFTEEIGLPVIIRPAYTLGGTGGGIAYTWDELREIAASGIMHSRVDEILVEKNISGWKEIEYEVMRDRKGNAITICNMENVDPVGVHTGDSSLSRPAKRSATRNTRCCAPRRSRSSPNSASRAAVTYSLPCIQPRSNMRSLRSTRVYRAPRPLPPRQPVIRSPRLRPRSPLVTAWTRSTTRSPARPKPALSRPSTILLPSSHAGRSISSFMRTTRSAPR